MPSIPDILHAFDKLNRFSDGKNWKGSHNDQPLHAVDAVDCGLNGTHLWVRARFQDGDDHKEVRGERDLLSHHIKITFGPKDQAKDVTNSDELVLSNRLVTTEWRIVLEFLFENGGQKHRYRFDGTAVTAGDIVKGAIIV